ncbi:LPXTG cell wall anchor domain-containing protein [Staphylococcus sp. 17KM0847]|uniref:GA-like domain-containing protein n=1 Tax=Staphylococcus sp. 17KM0847 TaxID=2583989 RepID=UPI0035B62D41
MDNPLDAKVRELEQKLTMSSDKAQIIKSELSEVYSEKDVEGISKLIDIDYENATAQEILDAIIYAGIQYSANQQKAHSFVALPRSVSTQTRAVSDTGNNTISETSRDFYDHFETYFGAAYTPDGDRDIVTLTPDIGGQMGAVTLKTQVNLKNDFSISGKVNLGDKYEGNPKNGRYGGDGILFGFAEHNVGSTPGLPGAGLGAAGMKNMFGFKLDTWHNTSHPSAKDKASADPARLRDKGAFGAFVFSDGVGKVITHDGGIRGTDGAAPLEIQPDDSSYVSFELTYTSADRTLSFEYGGQTWIKDVTSWVNRVRSGNYLFAITATTGQGSNLQAVDLTSGSYTQAPNSEPLQDVTPPKPPTIVEELTPATTSISGIAEPNTQVTITLPNGNSVETTANENGEYTAPVEGLTAGGEVSIISTDNAGNVSEPTKKIVEAGDFDLRPAEEAVAKAEAAEKAAEDKLAEVNEDGVVTPAEQAEVEAENTKVTAAKEAAEKALAEVPEGTEGKQDLVDRLAEVNPVAVPAVTDANDNGKADTADLALAEEAVAKAEAAEKAAEDKLAEVNEDGVVTPAEQAEVEAENTKVTAAKEAAEKALAEVPEGTEGKQDLVDRLAEVNPVAVPAVTDANDNGKADTADLALAEEAVAKAEAAEKAAEDKLAEVNEDGVVTPAEQAEVEAENTKVTAAKEAAEKALAEVPEGTEGKQDLVDRLAEVNPVAVPAVTDANDNGKADTADLALAEEAVAKAEAAEKAAEDKLAEVNEDGVVTPAEQAEVEAENTKVTAAKEAAEKALAEVPEGTEGKQDLVDRLAEVNPVAVPAVTDANDNGKADTADLALAEEAVAKAEAAEKAAEDKLAEVNEDGVVTPAEQAEVEAENTKVTAAKEAAEKALAEVPEGTEGKQDLVDRLAEVNPVAVPAVTDANDNGKADTADLALAEEAVAKAEAAEKAAEDKLAEVNEDGVVTPAEQAEVEAENTKVTAAKEAAEKALAEVPEGTEGKQDLVDRLAEVNPVAVPAVTDANDNGKADTADLALAEEAVAKAEAAEKAAEDKLAEVNEDGVVTPAEQAEVEAENTKVTAAKEAAEKALAEVPEGTEGKQDLVDRLAEVNPVAVPAVTDANDNGKADTADLALAEEAVAKAEAAEKAAEDKLAEVNEDGVVTPAEQAEVEAENTKVTAAKEAAEKALAEVPEGTEGKQDLVDRLAEVNPVAVPAVTDANDNGKADTADLALAEEAVAKAEAAEKAAEDKLAEVNEDGVVTPAEQAEVEAENTKVTAAKEAAEKALAEVPEGTEGKQDLVDRLAEVNPVAVPAVTDANDNGKADTADLALAEEAVAKAEAAEKAAEDKLAEVNEDGVVTPAEQAEVEAENTKVTAAKEAAEKALAEVPEGTEGKQDLVDRLAEVNPVAVPAVTDANDNGKADTADLALAEEAVAKAEAAEKAAEDKLAEVNEDGVVTPAEQAEVEAENTKVTAAKEAAEKALAEVPEGTEGKQDLVDRLAEVNPVAVPAVTDANDNGKADTADLALAEEAVAKAEAAEKAAEDKLAEVNEDGVVTPAEQAEVEAENTKVTAAKEAAEKALAEVPEGTEGKQDLVDRLAEVNPVAVPAVTDANDNGKADTADLALAEEAVAKAEAAEKAAEDKLAEVNEDGVVTPAEQAEVEAENTKVTAAKEAAEKALAEVPEGTEGKQDLVDRLAEVNPVAVPAVTDANDNGKADTADLALAEEAVAKAEAAEKAAEDKLAEVNEDGVVTPAEQAEVEAENTKVTAAKEAAEKALAEVPEGTEGKQDLVDRLAEVNPVAVPAVTDANDNGKADTADLALAEEAVAKAEAAEKAAEDKLAEVNEDGVVTPAEQAEVEAENTKVTAAKEAAEKALAEVPEGTEGKQDLVDRLAEVNPVAVPAVTDANDNGKADTADLALAEEAVAKAEAAEKAAEDKLAEVNEDGVVTPAEQAEVEAENTKVTAAKELPETGQEAANTTLLGTYAALLGSLFLLGRRRKENEEK